MHRHTPFRASSLSNAIACLLIGLAWPHAASAQDTGSLPTIEVSAPKAHEARASISGLGDAPEWQQPVQAQRWNDAALKGAQVQRLADLVKLDASVSDAYNAVGYLDVLSVRGFQLDPMHNFYREGLPIDAQTSIALENKSAIELLKGTSGMQSGVSSPGGLVNFLVKRPEGHVRTGEITFKGYGDVEAAVDIAERFGQAQQYGLRLNAAHEQLNTSIRNTRGDRDVLALAGDWRLTPDTLIEAELEYSRREQHSVPGFSMLGDTLPAPGSIDRNINLNDQPWAAPVIMQGTTGTVRLTHMLPGQWKAVATYGEQHTKADDRAAFPLAHQGCTLDCDRFGQDGSFFLWDYRSDGESRVSQAFDLNATGKAATGSVKHELTFGLTRALARIDLPMAAYNLAGVGNVSGDSMTSEDPTLSATQNSRRSRSTELYLRDSLQLSPDWHAWGGVRHSQIARAQWLSDNSPPAQPLHQSLTTPWLALGYDWAPRRQAYVSWGEGVEILPAMLNNPQTIYTNSGEMLPAMKSRQWEVGAKGQDGQTTWSVDYFHVIQPQASSILLDYVAEGDVIKAVKSYQVDGDARHQGIEAQCRTRIQAYTLDASAMVLDAKRRGSVIAGINDKAPVNVPDYAIKLGNGYRVSAVKGLTLQGDIIHEGPRTADAANNVRIPAWTRIDLAASVARDLGKSAIQWRLGIVNLLDTKAWRESPTQFDHIYLLPMGQRTITASAQISY